MSISLVQPVRLFRENKREKRGEKRGKINLGDTGNDRGEQEKTALVTINGGGGGVAGEDTDSRKLKYM